MWTVAPLASFATGAALGIALQLMASASVPLPEPRDPRVQYADNHELALPRIDPAIKPDTVIPRRPVRTIQVLPDASVRGVPTIFCPLGYRAGLGDECVWEGR